MKYRHPIAVLAILSTLLGLSACASLDQMDRKVDMAAEHLGSEKPIYEGQLVSARVVGPMTALQFADGQSYDVDQAPSALIPGDVLRVYKGEKGYIAHLWHTNENPDVSPTAGTPTKSRHGS